MILSKTICLLLLILIPLFLIFSLTAYKRMKKWLAVFADRKILRWKNLGRIFIISSLVLLATFSIVGVTVEYETKETQREGIHIIVGMDTSRSMLAEDTTIPNQEVFLRQEYPSRLNRGKFEVLNFIDLLQGEKVGLFFFAFSDVTIAPLTQDYQFCKYNLLNTDTLSIAFTGSEIGKALETASKMFDENSQYKVVVLVSDGELEDRSQLDSVLQEAKKLSGKGITVYTIGIGGDREVFIPRRDEWDDQGLFKDSKGDIITTRMNSEVLKSIASITNGEYFYANDVSVAKQVLDRIVKQAKNVEAVNKPVKKKVDLSHYFLITLLTLWLGWEFLISLAGKKESHSP
ncbi:VWA domain-containing protein [Candidatus Woesearchaeota archaeon]|nr:VWA domain-containing protein [Candidatus Woesearchaeota archaeon]